MTPREKNIYNTLSVALWAVVATGTAFGTGVLFVVHFQNSTQIAAAALPQVVLDEQALSAKAAVLYDLESGQVLYQKNAYEPLPLASLTKLMASEVVLSKKSPDTPVFITQADLQPEGNWGLKAGQTVMLGDLIRQALVASSNDAITAAASTLGQDPVVAMNAAAQELGLTKTRFLNTTGLDLGLHTAGASGSAYDVARLAALFFKDHPDLFELTVEPEVTIEANPPAGGGKELTSAATALPLQSIPGFVAAKTGYTDLAGGNVVGIFDLEPGHTVVASVLGSTRSSRFTDIQTLITAARNSLSL